MYHINGDERDAGPAWGHIENGVFYPIPKKPAIDAGYGPPPFNVPMWDGSTRIIVEDPAGSAA